MAKPILYYALVRASWSRTFGRDWALLCVTSEKGGQTYGRFINDSVTHVSNSDVLYRYPEGTTEEFAKAAADRATKEERKHSGGIEQARVKLRNLETAKNLAVLDAAKGLGPSPLEPDILPGPDIVRCMTCDRLPSEYAACNIAPCAQAMRA